MHASLRRSRNWRAHQLEVVLAHGRRKLLAIRDLGKYAACSGRCPWMFRRVRSPTGSRRALDAILFLSRFLTDVVPSVESPERRSLSRVCKCHGFRPVPS